MSEAKLIRLEKVYKEALVQERDESDVEVSDDYEKRDWVFELFNEEEEDSMKNDDVEEEEEVEEIEEIFPEINLIKGKFEGSFVEVNWNGCTGGCFNCSVKVHDPNEVGRLVNVVSTQCSCCTEYFCHVCQPVFQVNNEYNTMCSHCIKLNGHLFNQADLSKIEWIIENWH